MDSLLSLPHDKDRNGGSLRVSDRVLLLQRAQQVQVADVQNPVPSPCQSVCTMDASLGLCVGCLRSLAEIAEWSQATPERKRQIWLNIQTRVSVASGD